MTKEQVLGDAEQEQAKVGIACEFEDLINLRHSLTSYAF
jgi:hypothetical protein